MGEEIKITEKQGVRKMGELTAYYALELEEKGDLGYCQVYLKPEVELYLAEHLPKDCVWVRGDLVAVPSCVSDKGCVGLKILNNWKFCPYCGGKIVELPTEGE